jgi:hypothetical protein
MSTRPEQQARPWTTPGLDFDTIIDRLREMG